MGTLPQDCGEFGKVSGTLVLPPREFSSPRSEREVSEVLALTADYPFLQPLSGHPFYNLKLSPLVKKSAAVSDPS